MTIDEIRSQVEAAKFQAASNFDRNHGFGAYTALAKYSASEQNRRNLDGICEKVKK